MFYKVNWCCTQNSPKLDPVCPCGKPRCFNLFSHWFGLKYSIMELFDLSGVAQTRAVPALVGCAQCPPNVCEKFHLGPARLVSAIIRLPACMICPGGLLWLGQVLMKKTNKARLCRAAEIQVFLVFLCRLKTCSKCKTFQHWLSSQDM